MANKKLLTRYQYGQYIADEHTQELEHQTQVQGNTCLYNNILK